MHRIFSLRTVLFAVVVLAMSLATARTASAGVFISVGFAPPALPVYEQPICPGDGYIWTPGYWAWDADFDDYYWVPGTWILAPEVGFLWTPPWWGWVNGAWLWHEGYWGPHVGFYGGVNYGFGYFGVGFVGGRWDGGHFFYNRTVANINVVNIHNVYEERITNVTVNRVSFNGGPGGIEARPSAEEQRFESERHIGAIAAQTQHIQEARGNPEFRAAANHGRPPGVREAGGAYNPPANRGRAGGAPAAGGGNFNHARDLPAYQRETPNTGNAKTDRKYQQEQDKLAAKQQKEQQKLQQQQEKEHQQSERQQANEASRQQMEQRHQQQTQQMQQRHTEQQQHLQQRYQPPSGGKRR